VVVVRFLAVLSILSLFPLPARAAHRGFLELAAGAHTPLLGEQYRDMFGPGPIWGIRGGAFRAPMAGSRNALALEFAFEWVQLSDDVKDMPDQTYTFDEFRCMFGGRWMFFVHPSMHLYVRGLGGVEILSMGGTTRFGRASFNTSKSYAGLAIQGGVGASWRLWGVNVGAELTMPWSSHEDDGSQSKYHVDTAYDAFSVDLMLTVSTRR
jgi:hypothetical protein